jgi:branched-chain amino acid transport system permease protein
MIKKAALTALWFLFLTFPLLVIRVNTIEHIVEWRWKNMILVGIGSFVLSLLWQYLLARKESARKPAEGEDEATRSLSRKILDNPRISRSLWAAGGAFALIFPFLFPSYQTNIMTTALLYIVLGLGLNIVVGLAGLLNLGYIAFCAVGAYAYALLHVHFGLGFWAALPIGALLAALFGILLGFPVLRLRGDYLAIVTLGFGEIIRLVLENWNAFSFGPSGISNIPRPGFFGIELSLQQVTIYIYYLMIGLCLLTILVVNRLQDSRIGRAWIALREDELACEAMGVDKTTAKLTAFALGATWAGMAGVVLAAKTTFINPASFTFLESAMILSIVVLGGMGSIPGVILGALLLMLLPEYLRVFQDYRMLLFGATMVLMMVFRPQGMITAVRRSYLYKGDKT